MGTVDPDSDKPQDHFSQHFQKGSGYYQQGRYAEAVNELQEAIRIDPNQPDVHCGLAIALAKLGRHEDAVAAFRAALQVNPRHPLSLYNLGIQLNSRGIKDQALVAFEEFLKAAPPDDQKHIGYVEEQVRRLKLLLAERVPAPTVPAKAFEWQPGKVLLDDFMVERFLGRGGMGEVYLVKSRTTGARFALKRILPQHFQDDQHRQGFIEELKTWLDLPSHPNIAACHFFRTVEDGLAIFAGYAEGGSLLDWLSPRDGRPARLYEGGNAEALKRILDVAIQFAWGLHAIHQRGLVHEDVKPANVLMTADGVPMLADFGLARARSQAMQRSVSASAGAISLGATCQGGTPAFWSPEQARFQRLSAKTDTWSWGLSILYLFTRGMTPLWKEKTGIGARDIMEAYLRESSLLPSGVAEVLRRCFQGDPAARWGSLAEAGQALVSVHAGAFGPYARQMPAIEAGPAIEEHDRRTPFGVSWDDPRKWLKKAYGLGGRDADDLSRFPETAGESRKAHALDDLAVYEEVVAFYDKLVASGTEGALADLANVCVHKALLHRYLDDGPGALVMYDRAIAIRERLVNEEGRSEYSHELAICYSNKAVALSDAGNKRAAIGLYDRAIAIRERLVNEEGRGDLADDLATCYSNKAVALSELGDKRAAIAFHERAIAIRERLVEREGRNELSGDLAGSYSSKAIVLSDLGDKRAAVELQDRAIAIMERLVEREGRSELAGDLSTCYLYKALALSDLGDRQAACGLLDRAIAIRERLVLREGRSELVAALARCYSEKAYVMSALGDKRGAIALYDRAIAIMEKRVQQEGRNDLSSTLATFYSDKALALSELGEKRAAVELYDRAIAIKARLVEREGRGELANDLATCCANKAVALSELGDKRGAVALYDQVIAIRERLVNEEGRGELSNDLARCYLDKAKALNDLGESRGAVDFCDKAIAIRERLVQDEGRRELTDELATCYSNKANAVSDLGDKRGAIELYDRAIAMKERLVLSEGRNDVSNDLATCYANKAVALAELGDKRAAISFYDRAIAIRERLVLREGRTDLAASLERVRGYRRDLAESEGL